MLHGLLIRLGLSVEVAGHLLTLAAALLLVAGGARGVGPQRDAGADGAWALAVLALASRTLFQAIAAVRGDLLPVALGVMGLGLVPRDDRESTGPAVALLTAALLAEATPPRAPAAAVLALWLAARRRQALVLAAGVAVATAAGLVAANAASHGQMLVSLRACASGGGLLWDTLPRSWPTCGRAS